MATTTVANEIAKRIGTLRSEIETINNTIAREQQHLAFEIQHSSSTVTARRLLDFASRIGDLETQRTACQTTLQILDMLTYAPGGSVESETSSPVAEDTSAMTNPTFTWSKDSQDQWSLMASGTCLGDLSRGWETKVSTAHGQVADKGRSHIWTFATPLGVPSIDIPRGASVSEAKKTVCDALAAWLASQRA